MIIEEFEENLKKIDKIKKDEQFAVDMYRALCNMRWKKAGTKEVYSCSWRYAGGLIAEIRNVGENYLHFYCSGEEGDVTKEINKIFNSLGWIQHPWNFDDLNKE